MYVVVSLSVRTFLPDNFVSLIINTRVSTYLRNVKQTQKSAVGTAIEINVEQPRLENKRNGERKDRNRLFATISRVPMIYLDAKFTG